MAITTGIEWTDASWNAVTGCTRCGPGCLNCYMMPLARRLQAMGQRNYRNGSAVTLQPHMLQHPLKWKKPKKIFVNSMSDMFHDEIPKQYIGKMIDVMLEADQHTYQVLTKRPERMSRLLHREFKEAAKASHIWWGTSVENLKHGVPRIDMLRDADAKVPWLSIEPLLEDLGELDLDGIKWVVVGGESGKGCRPMEADWVRSIRDQSEDAGIPFFFKQWGGFPKKKNGRMLDGRTWDEFPIV